MVIVLIEACEQKPGHQCSNVAVVRYLFKSGAKVAMQLRSAPLLLD